MSEQPLVQSLLPHRIKRNVWACVEGVAHCQQVFCHRLCGQAALQAQPQDTDCVVPMTGLSIYFVSFKLDLKISTVGPFFVYFVLKMILAVPVLK